MVKVLKTNNNYYVAFDDNITLTADEIRQYQAATYNDPKIPNHYQFKEQFPKANSGLTRMLMKEINAYIPPNGKAINELADNSLFKQRIQETSQRTNRVPYYVDYTIDTKDLPSDYATSGIPIRREEEYYFTKYDQTKKRYICCNENGVEIKINKTRASFDFKKMEVFIKDKVFFFTPEEKQTIKKINNLKGKPEAAQAVKSLSEKELALYSFYYDITDSYIDKKQKEFSVNHELKHALTQQKINRRRRMPNYLELSPTNTYRFGEDDEKSAHLKETYLGISKFFKSGGDLSVFPKKSQWLVDKIKNLSHEKQQEVLMNNSYIVNGNINNWNKFYAPTYAKDDGDQEAQSISLAAKQAWDAPVFRMEDGDAEYIERRSIAYTFDVYNPQTGKNEKKDFSKFIQIPTEVRNYNREDINKLENIRKQRRKNLEAKGITRSLILSLFNDTYQSPFQINQTETLKQKMLEQGISLVSKNKNGEPITIKAQSQNHPNRPNCISLTTYRDNQPIFSFILDKDRKEYNCFNYRTKQKYSNLKNSKHPELPQDVKMLIKGYQKQVSEELNRRIALKINSNQGNTK